MHRGLLFDRISSLKVSAAARVQSPIYKEALICHCCEGRVTTPGKSSSAPVWIGIGSSGCTGFVTFSSLPLLVRTAMANSIFLRLSEREAGSTTNLAKDFLPHPQSFRQIPPARRKQLLAANSKPPDCFPLSEAVQLAGQVMTRIQAGKSEPTGGKPTHSKHADCVPQTSWACGRAGSGQRKPAGSWVFRRGSNKLRKETSAALVVLLHEPLPKMMRLVLSSFDA